MTKSDEVLQKVEESTRARTDNKLARIVCNADLRSGHDGLNKLAKSLRINMETLEVGEWICFVNRRRSAAKFLAPGGMLISHFRMPNQSPMNPKVIRLIPKYFNGRDFKYDSALAEVVKKEFHVSEF